VRLLNNASCASSSWSWCWWLWLWSWPAEITQKHVRLLRICTSVRRMPSVGHCVNSSVRGLHWSVHDQLYRGSNRSDGGTLHCWGLGLSPSSGILEEHSVSETGSVSVLRCKARQIPTQLGALQD
jgi:hypothetical protein